MWTLSFNYGSDNIQTVFDNRTATIYRNGKYYYKRDNLEKEYTPNDVTQDAVMRFTFGSDRPISNMKVELGDKVNEKEN